MPFRTSPDVLTPRETEVLILVAQGYTTISLAHQLGISFKTAVCHRTHIHQKLDIHDVANLTRYAVRSGLVQA